MTGDRHPRVERHALPLSKNCAACSNDVSYGFAISCQLSTRMDLERSFGPVYSRGLLKKGQTAFAVLGVNEQEPLASIDAALTFGILWLNACRESQNDRAVVEGLHLFVPPKSSGIVRERIAR